MLRRSKAVTNLNEVLNQAPEQYSAVIEEDIISYSSGTSPEEDADLSREELAQLQRAKLASFNQHQISSSKARAIPQPAPAKKTPDDDLRGVSVFKYSQSEHQMLEQARRNQRLAEAVFGYPRKL